MLKEAPQRPQELETLVTIVIPTLNEEQGIAKVLEELHSLGYRNILVIDGYSKDRTAEVVRDFGVKVMYQAGKGKTGAIKTALQEVSTPFVLLMDGDYTYDASSIPRFLQNMNSYDEIIGTRISTAESMSRLHRVGNKIITKLFNIFLGTKLSDVCSGMYMLNVNTARETDLQTSGFEVEAELAAQIATFGEITEVPVNYRPRLGREKLSTWRHGLRIINGIFTFAKLYNPGVFFSMLGGLFIIPAGLMLFESIVEWAITGRIASPWFVIGLSMFLVAIQVMAVGFLSLVLRRSELRTAKRLRKTLNSILTYRNANASSLLSEKERRF